MRHWDKDSGARGRCYSCAYLCRVVKVSPVAEPQYRELSDNARKDADFFLVPKSAGINIPTKPACFQCAAPLTALIEEQMQDHSKSQHDAAMFITYEDRKCKKWFPYTEGLTPAQHLEIDMLERVEQDRREWERSQEKNRREWEQSMERDRRNWESHLDEDNRRRSRRANWLMAVLAIAGLIFAIAEIFAAIVAVTPDSLGGKWFNMNQSQVETSDENKRR